MTTDTFEDGYKRGVEMATEYLRGVAEWFLKRDDVPASLAEVPAFLARIAGNIDDVGAMWADLRVERKAPAEPPKAVS